MSTHLPRQVSRRTALFGTAGVASMLAASAVATGPVPTAQPKSG